MVFWEAKWYSKRSSDIPGDQVVFYDVEWDPRLSSSIPRGQLYSRMSNGISGGQVVY